MDGEVERETETNGMGQGKCSHNDIKESLRGGGQMCTQRVKTNLEFTVHHPSQPRHPPPDTYFHLKTSACLVLELVPSRSRSMLREGGEHSRGAWDRPEGESGGEEEQIEEMSVQRLFKESGAG